MNILLQGKTKEELEQTLADREDLFPIGSPYFNANIDEWCQRVEKEEAE